jgi:hypothetical protein
MAISGNNGKLGDKAPKWRGYSADPEIQAFVLGQVRDGQRSAPEIKRLLLEEIGVSPSERTLQKMVKWASVTPAEPWTLADADRDEIALIAPVWAVALESGRRLTKGEADWIVRVRTAAPDLPPGDVWGMAGLYATESVFVTQGLRDAFDAVIAFAPWRSKDHAERYFAAANSGRIPSPLNVWNLATRAFLSDDGKFLVSEGSHSQTIAFIRSRAESATAAFVKSKAESASTNLGDSVAIEVKPQRRKIRRNHE